MKTEESHQTILKSQCCQQCQGTGMIFLRINRRGKPFIACDMCQGTGKHELNALWFVWGAYITAWRGKMELTLRQCALKYKIDPSNLSKMERGIIKPDTKLVQLACKYIYGNHNQLKP